MWWTVVDVLGIAVVIWYNDGTDDDDDDGEKGGGTDDDGIDDDNDGNSGDTNEDGKIDYSEFMAKFKETSYDSRMQMRAKTRMASLKGLMTMHMTSANDAFRFVSRLSI